MKRISSALLLFSVSIALPALAADADLIFFNGKVITVDGNFSIAQAVAIKDGMITAAGGSDHMIGYDKDSAINPYNPFLGMYCAVTRRTNRGNVVHPEERITREEALKMYTVWAAYRQFSEGIKGSIEPGKLADLVVVDRDYLTCPEDQIKDIEPLMTILNGRIAYRKQSTAQ
jgi:predicted amidohydrolase YtcJ